MLKIFMMLSILLGTKNVLANEALIAFSFLKDNYIDNLSSCTPAKHTKTLQIGEYNLNIYIEISGLKDDKCMISAGMDEEYHINCQLPPDKLSIFVSHFRNNEQYVDEFSQIITNPDYCQIEGVKEDNHFKDKTGIEFDCDTIINVQMVSDEECLKCRNRILVEDSHIKLSGKPLTYCVLKFCPVGYLKDINGKCLKQD